MGRVRPTVVFGDGSTATVRFTGVLRLEDGIWRVVQSHLSVGATNEETLGYEMTTTIEALADAVQQERPDLAAATAADGTVTIAFSDLEGSTEPAVRLGDEKWLDLLRWHDRVVESAVTKRTVASSNPSATDTCWRSRLHLERCEPRSEIQRSLAEPHDGETLRLRIGLHSGEVLEHADDLFGQTVIMAARVAAAGREAQRSLRPRRSSNSAERAAPSHSERRGRPISRASPVSTSSFRSSGTRSPELASISLAERMN